MKAFAEDDSRSPPPTSFLDRLIRRYSRAAYVVVVLGLYLLASTAMGLALAPAIWCWELVAGWSQSLPFLTRGLVLGLGSAVSFFVFGFGLLLVVPLYNLVLPTRVRPFTGGYYTLRAVEDWVPILLGVVAASMIYVAVADLIPGLHKRPELRATASQSLLIVLGVASIALVRFLIGEGRTP